MKAIIITSPFASIAIVECIKKLLNLTVLYKAVQVLLSRLPIIRKKENYAPLFMNASPGKHIPHESGSHWTKCSEEKAALPILIRTMDRPKEEILSPDFLKADLGKPMAVLVEDNTEFRNYLKNCLSTEYVIKAFEDGTKAWECLQKEHPDIVIGNSRLQGISGVELSLKLKNKVETSSIPVILYASAENTDLRYKRQASLADTFLLFPFSIEDLKVEISMLITNARAARRSVLQEIFGEQFLEAESNAMINDKDANLVNKVKDFILNNMDNEKLKIKDIASHVNMCQTSFYKQWKSLTGETPSSFLQSLRMQKARVLLESGNYLVADIPVMIGIKDEKYFRTIYKQYFKRTPSQSIRKR